MVGALSVVVVLVFATAVLFDDLWKDTSMPVQGAPEPAISLAELDTVDRTAVFFGHQSVGENILDGVPVIYAAEESAAPPIGYDGVRPGPAGGFIEHAFLPENGKPLLKIENFDKELRGGVADRVDVALMKLCFLDITAGTDVDAVFAKYRDTIAGLQRDFPHLRFVHVTVPLTTDATFKQKVKMMLGGSPDGYGQTENVARERYNTLVRNTYGADHLFDIAAVESTSPTGNRSAHQYDGREYYALYQGYASDLGHLNAEGSEVLATAFLEAIASASPR
ncbi:hypothetical protein AWB99_02070 [Mycolicibacterium confluentis]|uniref:Uncharacterized protein n=1 Tax=Mycolicibacterium confluentis TaxID=28047 RepID=A0A7I7XZX2_9MYCO|nr:hypothetical protein AWB99_02070 [Mycolicibacterium confluentis]BBZ34886.1 hypothetical protein MCNF_34910 [Mycolicibacterium confluentis]